MTNIFPKQKLRRLASQIEYSELEQKIAIVSRWLDDYNTGTLKTDKETSREQAYNQDIFIKVLGYEEKPSSPYSFEPKPSTSKGELPDAIVGHLTQSAFTFADQKVSAVVELKGTSVALDKPQKREGNMSPVQQGFKYKPKYKYCPFVIVSNFYEFRLYQDNQLDYEVWTLEDLCNPEDDYIKFKTFYFLLNKHNFVAINGDGKSNTEELLSDIRVEQEEIGKKFYAVYKQARLELLRSMWRNNDRVKTDIEFGIEKAQKIIDRIVFACFAEDRGLLPDNTMAHVIKNSDSSFGTLWENLRGFFNAIDVGSEKLEIPNGYNGGLFAKDKELDELCIDDEPLRSLAELGTYDFNEQLSVQILGHIFEQSISDLEEIKEKAESVVIKNDIEVQQVKKISKRKKDGIFYTPDYIVNYIVQNSLGNYLSDAEEKFKSEAGMKIDINDKTYLAREKKAYTNYQKFLQNVKVCDPACGSGAFLVQVFDFLLAENKRVSEILDGDAGSLFNTDLYIKNILTNNIYGVDLNEESVEITKLSLWLKSAEKGKPLTSLNSNIKCGNSLIDDAGIAGDKAFNWQNEFPEIFKNGGFDVIVGNPPYVRLQGLKDGAESIINYYTESYVSATQNFDIYVLFIEKAFELIKDGGVASYILPHKFLIAEFGKGIRKYLLDHLALESILIFGEHLVFEVTTYTCIIKLVKKTNTSVKFQNIDPLNIKQHFNWEEMGIEKLSIGNWNFMNSENLELFTKLKKQPLVADDVFAKIFVGLQTSADAIFFVNGERYGDVVRGYSKACETEIEIEYGLLKPMLKGEDISRYASLKNKLFVIFPYEIRDGKAIEMTEQFIANNFPKGYEYLKKYEKPLREREHGNITKNSNWFLYGRRQGIDEIEQLKIITPEISLGCNMTLDSNNYYHNTKCYSFILKEPTKDNYLFYLGILNSKIMWYFLKNTGNVLRGGYFTFKTNYLKPFPLPDKENDSQNIVDLVQNNLEFNENKTALNARFKKVVSIELGISWSSKMNNWWELSFEVFVGLIKGKLTLNQKEELYDMFEKYKKQIDELQTNIKSLDREIDNLVFELYDLTADEISIIENSSVV